MPLEPSPLPRPSADPHNLLRLREKALARMKLDEDLAAVPAVPAGVVTRRWSMQRLAVLLAAFTPGVGALVRPQKTFASVGPSSERCGAPQYGAPVYPNARVPYTPPPAPPSDDNPHTVPVHDGQWWNDKSTSYKEGFLVGYKGGEERVSKTAPDLKKFASSEVIAGLDHLYKDFRNRSILVDDAIPYVVDQLRGVDDAKLAAELHQLRAAAVSQ